MRGGTMPPELSTTTTIYLLLWVIILPRTLLTELQPCVSTASGTISYGVLLKKKLGDSSGINAYMNYSTGLYGNIDIPEQMCDIYIQQKYSRN